MHILKVPFKWKWVYQKQFWQYAVTNFLFHLQMHKNWPSSAAVGFSDWEFGMWRSRFRQELRHAATSRWRYWDWREVLGGTVWYSHLPAVWWNVKTRCKYVIVYVSIVCLDLVILITINVHFTPVLGITICIYSQNQTDWLIVEFKAKYQFDCNLE